MREEVYTMQVQSISQVMSRAIFNQAFSKPTPRIAVMAFVAATALVAVTNSALAASTTSEVKEFSIYQEYISPRAMGMGNAFTAVADDASAIFYNPAGLARLKEGQVNLGLAAAVDSKMKKFYNDIQSAIKSKDQAQITQLLTDNYGKHYGARVPTLDVMVARPKWALAIIPADLNIEMGIHQLAGAALDIVATEDTTIAYGRGWDAKWFKDSRVSFGVTGKAIYRAYLNKAILAPDLISNQQIFQKQDAKEGFTADADVGTLWTPNVSETSWWRYLKPTLGASVNNIADYGFASSFHLIDKLTGKPVRLGRRFNLGSMFELPDFWIFKTRFAADMRDMGNENWTAKKGAHLGFEFLWKIRSWWQGGWRVGVSQGYFTGGFTGKAGIFNLDLVTYAEEEGPSNAPLASRRYMAKVSLDW
jgi:hypothetical protein